VPVAAAAEWFTVEPADDEDWCVDIPADFSMDQCKAIYLNRKCFLYFPFVQFLRWSELNGSGALCNPATRADRPENLTFIMWHLGWHSTVSTSHWLTHVFNESIISPSTRSTRQFTNPLCYNKHSTIIKVAKNGLIQSAGPSKHPTTNDWRLTQ
jgi:hypothetical protein